ncbi:MAG: hypothetical protein ACFB22_14015 [Rhodothalassiaceae bacterium]
MAASVPKDPALDSTISLLREGFGFIGSRCDRFGSDLFETRLLGERTMCMRGPAAAEVFLHGGAIYPARRVSATHFEAVTG